jgi:hydroxyacylglutathione hydrolase
VTEGDIVSVLGVDFSVLNVPGHTLDHIAYYSAVEQVLFCGDTLFVGGCGRVFEGTPPQMRGSLEKLRGLPPETLIFCAHEYTLANLRFARLVEPKNSALSAFLSACESKRANDEPTVPSRISDELACNPFLRWDSPEVRETLKTAGKLAEDTADGIFTAVREWKNTA